MRGLLICAALIGALTACAQPSTTPETTVTAVPIAETTVTTPQNAPVSSTTTTAAVDAEETGGLAGLEAALGRAESAADAAGSLRYTGTAESGEGEGSIRVEASAEIAGEGALSLWSVVRGDDCEDHSAVIISGETTYIWAGKEWETRPNVSTSGGNDDGVGDVFSAVTSPLATVDPERAVVMSEGDVWTVTDRVEGGRVTFTYRFEGEHLAEAEFVYLPDEESEDAQPTIHTYRFSDWGADIAIGIPDTSHAPSDAPSCYEDGQANTPTGTTD